FSNRNPCPPLLATVKQSVSDAFCIILPMPYFVNTMSLRNNPPEIAALSSFARNDKNEILCL
ncbi:MAG: hypothetical protein Q8L01_00985, partial [Candidatus Woesebacteria bacterium]|nr:hypothetical protein [Candidatus Woesebacteria bacterium]